jgi:hypothetical protein
MFQTLRQDIIVFGQVSAAPLVNTTLTELGLVIVAQSFSL